MNGKMYNITVVSGDPSYVQREPFFCRAVAGFGCRCRLAKYAAELATIFFFVLILISGGRSRILGALTRARRWPATVFFVLGFIACGRSGVLLPCCSFAILVGRMPLYVSMLRRIS